MKMRLYIKRFGRALAACAALFAAACDDRLPEASDAGVATEPTPVHIEVSRVALRAVSDAATRTAPSVREWKDGDAIQITAVFNGEKITDKNSKQQYCCYKYNSTLDEWEPDVPVNKLMWPVGVESATFTAYYVEGIKGAFSGGTEVRDTVFLLGNIEEGSDPLYCTFHAGYGESVHLNFQHLCTHLTLADVKTEISDIYWLYGNAGTEASASEIPNAYKLEYDAAANKLKFSFVESLKSTTGGSVDKLTGEHYVVSRKRSVDKDGSGWVDFYLAPSTKSEGETREPDATYTYGKNCKLNYVNNHPYLSFTSDELDTLQAGIHYELSVERNTGIVPEPQTDFPDKPGDTSGYVHIPDLLAGIVSNSDVTDETGQLVLKSTGETYPRLLRDVDFHDFNPLDYIRGTGNFDPAKGEGETPVPKNFRTGPHPDWKLPRMEGNILDGDYRSFLHVAYPIFYSVENGEIYNLAIRDSKLDITVKDIQRMDSVKIQGDNATEGAINTDFGILAAIFRGKVSALLLDKVDMTVHLDSCLLSGSAGVTYSIGCVAGRQAASTVGKATIIENVELRGDVKLTVQTDGDEGMLNSRQDICVGIIAGQSGATIDGVTCAESSLTDTKVPGKCTLSLPIYSQANVKAGGLVGKEVMTMQDASGINVEVNASQLNAAQCYIGGLVGEIVNENTSYGKLFDCTANVAVTGGISHGINDITYSYSYCGGIAGKASTVEIKRITIRGTVKGGTETVEQPTNANMMVFATGGGFGYVSVSKEADLQYCRVGAGVTAASLSTSGIWGNHTGCFAGMTPDDYAENTNGNWASASSIYKFVGHKETEPTVGGGRN